MYSMYTVTDTVRVPPAEFGADLKKTVLKLVQKEYEGLMDEDLGLVVVVPEIESTGEGRVVPGDGAAYYTAVMKLLVYKPEVHEVVDGYVTEVTEFGAFARIGPIEGLIHVSQIMDDYINYDAKLPGFVGKESARKLLKGDNVTARIVTVSLKGSLSASKIGLTMRQDGLGKEEWVKAGPTKKRETKETRKEEKAKEKAA
ncbi:MAG TPA: DNA-directed RNA polymerase [Candidatus Diapherotrites archaeon]|uniref:DNA-directed RNA polymerase subunit Rpo7 n=1 Tax=Candidatus Iainarchaeum sp. TaxID=3101447 RepID=A0A7J4JEN8_9ARCH|nr:DNA-directed RNA polymerase [Candidatus Diapherotrites archaeon]HIH16232.1 DNA-directed RNA polymerase [Candidatus Diapherotrites archaeon]